MGPYTPDLLRRPMTPCTSSSSASSMAVSSANRVSINGGTRHTRDSDMGHTNGSQRTDTNSPSRIKRQIYTNNNHMVLHQQQLSNYFGRVDDGSQPSSSTSSADANDWRRVKCVLVGDAAVGKTSLIVSYTTNGYPHEYVPTAFDNYTVSVRVDNQPIKLQLCDTAGQDDFDSLRPLCYPNTDVFLVCFSVVNPASFESLKSRWIREIRHHSARTPFILVGTECDLRTNIKVVLDLHRHQLAPVTESQARHLADEVGAATYLECSSLTQQNLKETFDAAILVGLEAAALGEGGRSPPGSTVPGRKSLRKLKEKLTTSRTNSIDSMKNPNFLVRNLEPAPEVQQRPVERYSTHSSASHVHVRGRNNKKKLSTASVPTIGVELNTVVMNMDGGLVEQFTAANGHSRNKALRASESETVKSRKGWRKLLCVA